MPRTNPRRRDGRLHSRQSQIARSATRRTGRALEDGVMLLAGVGTGLALMYLLDPSEGRNRRGRLVQSAGTALESAGRTAGAAWGAVASKAAQVGADVRARAADANSYWMEAAGELIPRRAPEHHYVGQTVCALGSMILGAGLTYLLDPSLGGERRERLSRRISGAMSSAGEMCSAARHSVRRWVRREDDLHEIAAETSPASQMDPRTTEPSAAGH